MADEDKPTGDAPQDGGTLPEDSQTTIDDVYKDKSLEDIVKMHKELKSHSDRQLETVKAEKDKEIAARDKDLQAYKSWYEQQRQQATAQPAQPPPDQEAFNTKFVNALLEDPITTLDGYYNTRRMEETYKEAWAEGPSVLAEAKRRSPGTFEGVDEAYLNNVMYGGLRSGSIQAHDFKKPEAWVMGAWQLKGVGSNFSSSPASPRPSTPPGGDLPPSVKPQVGDTEDDDIEFDPLTLELMEGFGKTKTQAADMIHKWRDNPDPRMQVTRKKE